MTRVHIILPNDDHMEFKLSEAVAKFVKKATNITKVCEEDQALDTIQIRAITTKGLPMQVRILTKGAYHVMEHTDAVAKFVKDAWEAAKILWGDQWEDVLRVRVLPDEEPSG